MAYLIVYQNWLPYALMKDRRGFLSRRFGDGHTGVDSVGNEYANPVCAVVNGVVRSVTENEALGKCVEYGSEAVRVAYYHLANVAVKVGDRVQAGVTKIGTEGASGTLATGKHLHSSLWINGVLTDPELYFGGKKELVAETAGEKKSVGVRRVIRNDLNLRVGAGVGNATMGLIPKGRLLNVQERVPVGKDVWGKVTVKMADGNVYSGYSNLGETWSEEYGGAVREDGEDVG